MNSTQQDIFAEAREKYTVPDLWPMLRLPGEPKRTCRSPFRDERNPSFSIFDNGKAWTDHGTGEGGDVIEFIKHAINGDYREVRDWLCERLGIDFHDHWPTKAPSKPATAPQPEKHITWPGELIEGTQATWHVFAMRRGISYPAVHAMIHAGILRFCRIDGVKCYVITDESRRAAEIRRCDDKPFGETKAYPLRGVDKSWMPGLEMLKGAEKNTAVLITEGATDLISAIDTYSRYRREHKGKNSWQPVALLGAGCKRLHPQAEALLRGRYVRLVPDADPAGDMMADHWSGLLRKAGCTVDIVNLPQDTDLTDNLSTIQPTDLFSL